MGDTTICRQVLFIWYMICARQVRLLLPSAQRTRAKSPLGEAASFWCAPAPSFPAHPCRRHARCRRRVSVSAPSGGVVSPSTISSVFFACLWHPSLLLPLPPPFFSFHIFCFSFMTSFYSSFLPIVFPDSFFFLFCHALFPLFSLYS